MRGFQKSVAIVAMASVIAWVSSAWAVIYTPPVTAGLVIQYDASNYNATTGIWTNSGSYTGTNAGFQANANAQYNTNAAQNPSVHIPSVGTPINSEPTVHFSGGSADATYELLASYKSGNPFAANSQATVFIVAKNATVGNYELLQSSNRGDDYTSFGGAGYEGLFRNARLEATPASGMPASNAGPYIYEVDSSSSAYSVLVNDTSKATAAGAFQLSGGSTPNLIIGANGALGAGFNGDIAQILIYNTTLTTDQRNQIGSSLATFYGFSTTYPAPEPASLGLLAVGGVLLLKRRRA